MPVNDGLTSGPAGDHRAERVGYADEGLLESDLAATPLLQFERWYAQVRAAGVAEPNAMVLSTVDPDGAPSARTVLLKQVEPAGFVLFTNHGSRKARQMDARPAVALTFPWHPAQRQVAVRGLAERVDRAQTQAYFTSRPWGSRIGAWASHQSAPVASRAELEARWSELAQRWPDTGSPDDVPVPEHWGGYRVRPVEVELWAGRSSRMHDRLVYLSADRAPARLDDPAAWRLERRQP